MSYSCVDFVDDVLAELVHRGYIAENDLEDDNPGQQAECVLPAIARLDTVYHSLKEFISDVDAVGAEQVGKEWPDLLITYKKACRVLAGLKEGKS